MLSTIIYGGSSSDRAQEVTDLSSSLGSIVTHIEAEKTSITIAQIQSLIKDLGLTSSKPRLIWIEEADLLTLPAQNALLKALEEPAKNTIFILTLKNPKLLLPTITSRCQLQKLTNTDKLESDGQELALIKEALALEEGKRVALADSLGRKRDVLQNWTSACLTDLQNKMGQEDRAQSLKILAKIATLVHLAHTDLSRNISPGLTMQNLFLSLPRTKS